MGAQNQPAELLTRRQLEVLELMSKGLTNPEIAKLLKIATGTVKTHVAAIIASLEVSNRTEAATRLAELGLTGSAPPSTRIAGFGNRGAIAVLPFECFSTDPELALLTDGLVEDLITILARWRWFPVISRNSTFAYRGRAVDVRQVAAELGASYVIEGSVRPVGDTLRITVQVIGGDHGHHVGTERFDVPADEIIVVTDDIVNCIVARLEPALVNLSGLQVMRRKPEKLDAWQNFQRGFHVLMRHTPDDCAAAALLFDQAAALDSGLSVAHSMWAYAQLQQSFLKSVDLDPSMLREVERRAELARSIDPTDPLCHQAIAWHKMYSRNYEDALQSVETALELEPSLAWAYVLKATLLTFTGDAERGCEAALQGLRLSPFDPEMCYMHFVHGLCLITAGQLLDAKTAFETASSAAPDMAQPYLGLIACHALTGNTEAALSALQQLMVVAPDFDPAALNYLMPEAMQVSLIELLKSLGFRSPPH